MKNMNIVTRIRVGFTAVGVYTVLICILAIAVLQGGIQVEAWSDEAIALQAFVLLCMIMAIGTGIGIAHTIIVNLRKPLQQLQKIAVELAQGNTDVHISERTNDELGQVINEFEKLITATEGHVQLANKIAQGDMTVEVTMRSDKDALGRALKEMVRDNNAFLLGIKESSMQLTSGAGQVASASQALAQGSTQQASAIEQITVSMGEIAKATSDNAEAANEADRLIDEMMGSTEDGSRQMGEMMSAMQEIQSASKSISKVIKTIDDIAFQTNILALNATVEAARAGEHGKGFAVVAEEVKNLAEKSAEAAQETAELIQSSIDKVESGSKIADDMADALAQIVASLEKVVQDVHGIAETSNHQATAVAQINQAITQVSQVVQTNSATSEECASASEELSNQALALRNMISKYRLREQNARTSSFGTSFYAQSSMPSYGQNISSNEQIISLGGEFGKY